MHCQYVNGTMVIHVVQVPMRQRCNKVCWNCSRHLDLQARATPISHSFIVEWHVHQTKYNSQALKPSQSHSTTWPTFLWQQSCSICAHRFAMPGIRHVPAWFFLLAAPCKTCTQSHRISARQTILCRAGTLLSPTPTVLLAFRHPVRCRCALEKEPESTVLLPVYQLRSPFRWWMPMPTNE